MLRPYALLHTLSFPTYPSVGSHLLVFTLMFSAIVVTYSPPCFPKIIIVQPFREQRSPTMASADFSLFVVTTNLLASETSPGKNDNLPLMSLPHLL